MPRLTVAGGKSIRNIPPKWKSRTDIPASVLSDPRVLESCWRFPDGRIVAIPISELRRVLDGKHSRKGKLGPFNIDLDSKTVDGMAVRMIVS